MYYLVRDIDYEVRNSHTMKLRKSSSSSFFVY